MHACGEWTGAPHRSASRDLSAALRPVTPLYDLLKPPYHELPAGRTPMHIHRPPSLHEHAANGQALLIGAPYETSAALRPVTPLYDLLKPPYHELPAGRTPMHIHRPPSLHEHAANGQALLIGAPYETSAALRPVTPLYDLLKPPYHELPAGRTPMHIHRPPSLHEHAANGQTLLIGAPYETSAALRPVTPLYDLLKPPYHELPAGRTPMHIHRPPSLHEHAANGQTLLIGAPYETSAALRPVTPLYDLLKPPYHELPAGRTPMHIHRPPSLHEHAANGQTLLIGAPYETSAALQPVDS
jgi:hypothetical protein